MKTIKEKINIVVRTGIVLTLLTIAVKAADAQSRPGDVASRLSAELSINQQTALALKAAFGVSEQHAKDIQSDSLLSTKEKRQLMAELLAKRHRAVDSLLTSEQKQEFLKRASESRAASYSQTARDSTSHK